MPGTRGALTSASWTVSKGVALVLPLVIPAVVASFGEPDAKAVARTILLVGALEILAAGFAFIAARSITPGGPGYQLVHRLSASLAFWGAVLVALALIPDHGVSAEVLLYAAIIFACLAFVAVCVSSIVRWLEDDRASDARVDKKGRQAIDEAKAKAVQAQAAQTTGAPAVWKRRARWRRARK